MRKYSKYQIAEAIVYWKKQLQKLNENVQSNAIYQNYLWFHCSMWKLKKVQPPTPVSPFFVGDKMWDQHFYEDDQRCYIFKIKETAKTFDITSESAWKTIGFSPIIARLFNTRVFNCLYDLFPGRSDDVIDDNYVKYSDGYFRKYTNDIWSCMYDFLYSIELHDILHDAIKNNKTYEQYTINNTELKNDFSECAKKCNITTNQLFDCLKSIYDKSRNYSFQKYTQLAGNAETMYTNFFWYVTLSEISKAGFNLCTGIPRKNMEERIVISSSAIDLVNPYEYKPDKLFENAAKIINTSKYNSLSFIEKINVFNHMLKASK